MGNVTSSVARARECTVCCALRNKDDQEDSWLCQEGLGEGLGSPVQVVLLGEGGELEETSAALPALGDGAGPNTQSARNLISWQEFPELKPDQGQLQSDFDQEDDDLSQVLSARLQELARAQEIYETSLRYPVELPADDVKEDLAVLKLETAGAVEASASPCKSVSRLSTSKSPGDSGASMRGQGISSRLKEYQAACQSRSNPSSPTLEGKGPSRLRTLRSSPIQLWRTQRLANVRAQSVLKVGIGKVHEELTAKTGVNVEELPKSDDGRPKLLGSRMLSRLLSGELELKACTESDAASAQSDLRHLRTEQLTAIRSKTLDFATESATHNARNSFLETVDKHLFEKLTRQCLQGTAISLPANPAVLHSLGVRLVLIRGVVEFLNDGWGKADGDAGRDSPPIPKFWALWLEESDWPECCRVALFNVKELWLRPLLGERLDFAGTACGEPVAIFRDQSSGIGKDCMLHWEIAAVDPKIADVLEEMQKFEPKANGSQVMAMELSEVLAKRGIKGQ